MKKLWLMLALVMGSTFASQAQIKLPGGAGDVLQNFTAPPRFDDVAKTAGGITDLLGSKLSLSGDEKKSSLDAITGFLGDKKGIMGAAKFANFLKLKPGGNGAGNLLSNLFF